MDKESKVMDLILMPKSFDEYVMNINWKGKIFVYTAIPDVNSPEYTKKISEMKMSNILKILLADKGINLRKFNYSSITFDFSTELPTIPGGPAISNSITITSKWNVSFRIIDETVSWKFNLTRTESYVLFKELLLPDISGSIQVYDYRKNNN